MDHRQCRTEALSQFTIIKQKYTSIKTYRGQLGKLAALEEFKLAHLSVGGIVPEIVGKDIQGKPMRLSDYRGKVVVLDFWGDW